MEKSIGKHKNNKQWIGILIIVIGIIFLARTFSIPVPYWVTSWPMLLVGIGLAIGLANGFRDWAWGILVAIGGMFLIDDITGLDIKAGSVIIPFILIFVGVSILTKKKSKKIHVFDELTNSVVEETKSENLIDIVAVFGGNKKVFVSKNFQGGDIVSVFGGNEINLTKSDIQGTVKLGITQFMGGTKLIVPSNWIVRTEMVSIFGGLDDKRHHPELIDDTSKILLIDGVSIFAGVDIRSY